jgi:predicted metalloprotease with PDZ domain
LDRDEFLAGLSAQIDRLRQQPGRLLQTVAPSSPEVWGNSLTGVNPSARTVSHDVKGHVKGFLLDARIRRVTPGRRSLDHAIRLAYARYAGARGFTPAAFQAVAGGVAKADLGDWFSRAVSSTEELDHDDALAWYGLRFVEAPGPPPTAWQLAVRPDAAESQRARLGALLAPRSR